MVCAGRAPGPQPQGLAPKVSSLAANPANPSRSRECQQESAVAAAQVQHQRPIRLGIHVAPLWCIGGNLRQWQRVALQCGEPFHSSRGGRQRQGMAASSNGAAKGKARPFVWPPQVRGPPGAIVSLSPSHSRTCSSRLSGLTCCRTRTPPACSMDRKRWSEAQRGPASHAQQHCRPMRQHVFV